MNAVAESLYVPRCHARSRFTRVRGLRYHVREWGRDQDPTLVLLHGARDASASFQFVIDALEGSWHVVAPDWRGHGQSDWTPGNYWVADFLADLDALLLEYTSSGPIRLVGHSMGGSIASIYAGLRPSAVSHLVLLDSLGPAPDRVPVPMLATLRRLLEGSRAHVKPRLYTDPSELAARLLSQNPRLDPARAQFLAQVSARALPGGFAWAFDPGFTRSWPTLHNVDEWVDCWRQITAPVLCLLSSDPRPHSATENDAVLNERASHFRSLTLRRLPETSHNVHFDAPLAVAQALDAFLQGAGTDA